MPSDGDTTTTPLPMPDGPLTGLLHRRHSTRDFAPASLSLDDLAALLHAGYGRRRDGGGVVPSAHGLGLLSLFVVAGLVDDLPAAIYRYRPERHDLIALRDGDHRASVAGASLADTHWLATAAAHIVIAGDTAGARSHFHDQPPRGERGGRYLWLEAGHVSQNLYLSAADRGLGAVLVAGFDDDRLVDALPSAATGVVRPSALGIVAIGR